MEKIKIILADDHINVRRGLRKMLSRFPQVEVVAEAGDGIEALKLATTLKPDVMLLDVEMPGIKGIEVTKRLLENDPSVQVLALSGYNERRYIVGMFASGAAGYLTKDEAPKHLLNAIYAIAAGHKGWISPKAALTLGIPPHPTGPDTIPALTKIEMKILKCFSKGMTDLEIGTELEMENAAIAKHSDAIMRKLRVDSRSDAVLRAVQAKLI